MKKLKIVLLFSIVIYVIFIVKNNIFFCYYNLKTTELKGTIISYKVDGNYLTVFIKGKSKIRVTYYFKTEKELLSFKNNIRLGDYYHIEGTMEQISSNRNFNLFNYKNYLYSKKIYYVMKADALTFIKRSNNPFYYLRNKIIEKIETYESKTYLKLFLLGENNTDDEIKESYQNNGISHLFAISGMHITLFTNILTKLLKKIIKNKKLILVIISLFLLFYLFLTNFTPSVIRASFMYIIINIKKLLKIPICNKTIIVIIAYILLIYNPYYIYNVGFVFSFLVSFSLVLFEDKINIYDNKIIKTFITSLISFIVGIPIMINNYYNINLLTPFINIIFVPFISIILFPLSLLTFIIPPLDNLLKIIIIVEEQLSLFIDNYINITLVLKHIPSYIFILYYILIYLVLKNLNFKNIVILLMILIIHSNINYINPYYTVTALDIGQGDCILITLPHNKGNILIDTGGKVTFEVEKWKKRKKYDMSKSIIIPYLKSLGIKKLDYLILTHGDYDHMGEAINLVNNFKVENVIFNKDDFNNLELELIKVLDEKNIKDYKNVKELNLDNNKLYFLNNRLYDNENDNSNVIYTELNGIKLLLMGDAGVEVEEDILSKYKLNDIDILKVGHHGSRTSSSKNFINEMNPKYSIISVGKNNRYGHPNKEVLNTLGDSKIYRTDQDGSIMFKIKNNILKIETCSP